MRLKTILYLLPLVLLSSCFEFVEEISFDGEESGTCSFTLNCSESKLKIKNLMKLDTFMNFNIPSEYDISKSFDRISKNLAACKGITNVNHQKDFNKYIFSIQFHFDSISNLNDALNHVIALENKSSRQDIPYHSLYSKEDGVFKRLQVPHDSISSKIQKRHVNLFEGATITSVYRFQSLVDNVSNSKSIISKNRKAVMLKHEIPAVANNPALQSNTIKLK